MSASKRADRVSFRAIGGRGAGLYDVMLGDSVIGRVQRMQLGAGQFGTTWSALDPAGNRGSNFRTRDDASRWLVSMA